MYVNKFKCEKPPLSEFKDGVAFCSGCNKHVYDANVIDLKDMLSINDTVCASVPSRKISWMERSFFTLGIATASILTPIDLFAQNQSETDTNMEVRDSTKIIFSGIVIDSSTREVIEDGKVLLYVDGNLKSGAYVKEGVFNLAVDRTILKGENIVLHFKCLGYLTFVLKSLTEDGSEGIVIKLKEDDEDIILIGMVTNAYKIPLIDKNASPSGSTFGREDLKNIPR